MKKLNVAMICDMVPGQPGGSYLSAIRFAKLLIARGHKVIMITARDKRMPIIETYEGIRIYQFFSLPVPGSNKYYLFSLPTATRLREIFMAEKIEIVHTMFPSYSCYLAAKVAKKMKIPIVAHSHTQPENVSVFLPKFLKTKFAENLILKGLNWFLKPAKAVICPSLLGKKILDDSGKHFNITVISNGVDLEKFSVKKPAADFFEKYGLSRSKKQILFIGRLTEEKGIITLIKAIRHIVDKNPDTELQLVGLGPLRSKLKNLCRELKISDNVVFLEKISEEDLLSAFRSADLFILPSLVELEGMVVLEAMACGKPILIANSATSASVFFVKNNGLLFKPNDSKDLADKALTILQNDGLRKQMADNSLTNVRDYDINVSVAKLESVYFSVVNANRQ